MSRVADCYGYGCSFVMCCCSRRNEGPSINIGPLIALDTTNEKIAKTAIEMAVEDVNRNASPLNGTLLNIDIRDSEQDALTGASAGNSTSSTHQNHIFRGVQASRSTKFLSFKVSDGGEQLLNQILETNFLGLSGPVRISKERGDPLESSYDIINVVGSRVKVSGSWTERGLNIASTQVVNWGDGSGKTPPGKKLKIVVPGELGFSLIVSIKPVDAKAGALSQTYEITGFCIDVFKSVLKRLDYELPHELIPY
ncbi:hypothetical protein SUGI_1452200 [Cryptomeria japonica]|uniref:Receptor ligand binding region domain-containing protein n=1 Tax=Cryptomeria japonica TaxID=3369 RepID=A0AAD3NMR2_CRYJA|nr:hypothetical protein SUGI_0857530 [Cryptomeria japonica]GLJ58475.1 hypothetical protein SUGI_1452200 [Cryptomeria japonica]